MEKTTLLRDTVENFHDYILDKGNAIAEQIVGETPEFKQIRLNVYHEGYVLRLLEIMGKNYIVLKTLMGEELFEQVAYEYIRACPSQHFSVSYIGRHFSEFLANHLSDQQIIEPVWVEIAQFEWAMQLIIEGEDAPQLTFADMSALKPESWGDIVLLPHPSLKILPFHYATPTLWQAVRHDRERPALLRQEKPTQWLMWRFNRQVFFFATTFEQYTMMTALQQGETFSQVCERLCSLMSEDDVIHFAAQTLRQWIEEGVFTEFKLQQQE